MCGAQEHGSFWPLRCALRCQSSCKSRPPFGRQGSPPHDLDQITAPFSEYKQMTRIRALLQHGFRQGQQAIKLLAHVPHANRQPNLRLCRDRGHTINPSIKTKTAGNAVAPSTNMRRPSVSVISTQCARSVPGATDAVTPPSISKERVRLHPPQAPTQSVHT